MITNLKNTISTKGSGGMSTGSGDYKYNYGGIVPGAEAQAQALIDANMKSMGVSASNPASARLATVPSAGSESVSGALTAGAYGSLLADAEKTAAAERLASNGSVGGAAGEVELLERIDPTVEVNTNLINQLYAAQLQAELNGLEKQYDPLFGALDTNRESTQADFYEAVRQATALAAREKQAMNEMFNAAGLNTGAAGQAQLAGSAVKQQNINAINIAEAKALAEIEAQRAQLESEYQKAITEATLNNEQEKAAALLEAEQQAQMAMAEMAVAQALVDVENLTRQAEAAAANGDFSMYSRLGYEPAQIAQMEAEYKAKQLGSNYNAGYSGGSTKQAAAPVTTTSGANNSYGSRALVGDTGLTASQMIAQLKNTGESKDTVYKAIAAAQENGYIDAIDAMWLRNS